MGGRGAPDDLELGRRIHAWLAVSDDLEATRGGYWFHQHRRQPASAALDASFQDGLPEQLSQLTEVALP